MRGKRYQPQRATSHEFELDLAPLLAVMVKLVPVLLISSAFVQIMTIETDLPGSLTKVIEQSHEQKTQLKLQADNNKTIKLLLVGPKSTETIEVPAVNNTINFEGVHSALIEVKKRMPQVFHMIILPGGALTYQDMVKLMDESRKSKSETIEFTYTDPEKGEAVETQWMFPEVMIDPSEAT